MKMIATKVIGLFAILFTAASTHAQIISTIAGTGTGAFSGDGGAATAAAINTPHGVAIDGSGNIYMACVADNRIRKISTSGTITTIAGTGTAGYSGDGGPATAAQISAPNGVYVDPAGNIYFGESAHRARKINSSGIISTIAGNGTAGSGGDGGPATAALVNYPESVITDAGGNIYILENLGQKIRKINTAGIISTFAGTGAMGFSGDGGPATAATMNRGGFLYADALGNIYVSDNGNHRIRVVNTSGIITTVAGNGSATFGGDGGPATVASLNYPGGIIKDASGNLYIADCYNYRIRKVDPSGNINTFAGTGTSGFSGDGGMAISAQLKNPIDIILTTAGEFIIADMFNHRIRKIGLNYTPVFTNQDPSLPVCKNAVGTPINSMLAIIDTNAGQTETWTIITNPSHGTLGGFPTSLVSTGGTSSVAPTGLTYTPTTGYIGADAFTIRISDGQASDTIAIPVTVTDCHVGIDEAPQLKKANLSVIPNPSDGLLNLLFESEESGDISAVVTNILGQKVAEFSISPNKNFSFYLNNPAGVYFVTLTSNTGTYSKTIFIER